MANSFIFQAVGFLLQTSSAVLNILLAILGACLKVSGGAVALFWYALEACFGFDRTVTDFGYAFTCGILCLLSVAVLCGKFDVARWFYDIFDPILVCMDWAVMQGMVLFRGEPELNNVPFGEGSSGDAAPGPSNLYFPFPQQVPGGYPNGLLPPNGVAPVLHEFTVPSTDQRPPANRGPVGEIMDNARPSAMNGFNVYRTDTDESLKVRYRSSSTAAGRLLSDRHQSSRLLAGPSSLLAGVDPSAMPSGRDTTFLSTSMLQNSTDDPIAAGNKDVAESRVALNALEREIRLATHHTKSSPLHGNDDYTPSAPPLVTHSSAESIWLRARKPAADYTFLPNPKSRPLHSLGKIGEVTHDAGVAGPKIPHPEQMSGIAIKAASTRDVCTHVSKSLTALRADSKAISATGSMEGARKSLVCAVCQNRSKCMVTMPCRHMTSCEGCLQVILAKDRKCPLCRGEIEDFMKVYA